ncbi:hypothetical protein BASA81_001285 [Batrachochytrium salamandrivorans]|nr:hypothetical protein BASA81_001285 [Batrachochytrium salamandrivorans]
MDGTFSYRKEAMDGRQLFRHQVNGVTNYLLLTKVNLAFARLTGSDANGNEQPLPAGYTIVRVLSLTNQRQQARRFNNDIEDISTSMIVPIVNLPPAAGFVEAPEAGEDDVLMEEE